mmetsp:Transcript_9186/g.55775  ORF Transcript_9186/g.55775 Transcript_9186/m.55775 type:complete len:213 (+) Transcript_9186:3646-4284(+)
MLLNAMRTRFFAMTRLLSLVIRFCFWQGACMVPPWPLIGVVLAISKRCNARSCATNWELLTTWWAIGPKVPPKGRPNPAEDDRSRQQVLDQSTTSAVHGPRSPGGQALGWVGGGSLGREKMLSHDDFFLRDCPANERTIDARSFVYLNLLRGRFFIATNAWNARLSGHPRDKATPGRSRCFTTGGCHARQLSAAPLRSPVPCVDKYSATLPW